MFYNVGLVERNFFVVSLSDISSINTLLFLHVPYSLALKGLKGLRNINLENNKINRRK
jgi:hypothetical protein